jgi:hypothetical protein
VLLCQRNKRDILGNIAIVLQFLRARIFKLSRPPINSTELIPCETSIPLWNEIDSWQGVCEGGRKKRVYSHPLGNEEALKGASSR